MFEEISELELVRLAAFVDGEGSIVLGMRKGRSRDLRLQLCNTDPRLITWARDTFGGTITKEERSVRSAKNERNIFRWHVGFNRAAMLLKAIYPYLLLKKDQAEVALAYRSTIGSAGVRISEEVKAERLKLSEELSRLKRINYSVIDFSETTHPLASSLPN